MKTLNEEQLYNQEDLMWLSDTDSQLVPSKLVSVLSETIIDNWLDI